MPREPLARWWTSRRPSRSAGPAPPAGACNYVFGGVLTRYRLSAWAPLAPECHRLPGGLIVERLEGVADIEVLFEPRLRIEQIVQWIAYLDRRWWTKDVLEHLGL